MFRLAVLVLFCVCVSLTINLVQAITPEQKAKIDEHFEKVGLECIKDIAITEEDIINLKAKKVPTGANVPCFLACIMKNSGVMDDQGLLQKENVLELAQSVFKKPEEMKVIEDYLQSCSKVNDEPVEDANKGCARAMLAYKCMTENASKYGFAIFK